MLTLIRRICRNGKEKNPLFVVLDQNEYGSVCQKFQLKKQDAKANQIINLTQFKTALTYLTVL